MADQVKIQLTDVEKQLFGVITDAIHNAEPGSIYKTCEVRVAGGWVRDKVMGLHNHDIDIAISNMSGLMFANFVNSYMESKNLKTHSVTVIHSNPEQSKHLETATVKMLGLSVDFCNLRKEIYQEDSRIPIQEIGTAQEDAYRRDLTINALFYNIMTGQVEDFTNCGLLHIQERTICTPLEPMITFREDPLRILRAIRFTCRFEGFSMVNELIAAASSESVLNAFATKISKERIGAEFIGILESRRPELGIYYIVLFGLYPIIFKSPFEINLHYPERQSIHHIRQATRIVRSLKTEKFIQRYGVVEVNEKALVLAAPFSPYVGLTYKVKSKTFPITDYMVLTCLKLSGELAKIVSKLLLEFENLTSIINAYNENNTSALTRLTLGNIMRNIGPLWFEALIIASLPFLPKFDHDVNQIELDPLFDDFNSVLENCLSIRNFAIEQDLIGVWDIKPLLNGKEVMVLLDIKAGQAVKRALEKQIHWMLENPKASVDECKEWMKNEREWIVNE